MRESCSKMTSGSWKLATNITAGHDPPLPPVSPSLSLTIPASYLLNSPDEDVGPLVPEPIPGYVFPQLHAPVPPRLPLHTLAGSCHVISCSPCAPAPRPGGRGWPPEAACSGVPSPGLGDTWRPSPLLPRRESAEAAPSPPLQLEAWLNA